VVAAARAVGVEVALLYAPFDQIATRRRVLLDRSGRRDVVGRDAVAQQRDRAGALDRIEARRLGRHALEVGGTLDVRRLGIPRVAVSLGHRERIPVVVAVEHLAIAASEHVRLDRPLDGLAHLALRGPDVAQANTALERLADDVDVHPAGERVGDA
jgi:hypothetical protein